MALHPTNSPCNLKVDVRLPGKGISNSHGARPVHLIITMMKWIRISRLSAKKSLSAKNAPYPSIVRVASEDATYGPRPGWRGSALSKRERNKMSLFVRVPIRTYYTDQIEVDRALIEFHERRKTDHWTKFVCTRAWCGLRRRRRRMARGPAGEGLLCRSASGTTVYPAAAPS